MFLSVVKSATSPRFKTLVGGAVSELGRGSSIKLENHTAYIRDDSARQHAIPLSFQRRFVLDFLVNVSNTSIQ